jgi:TatD DNase family protein
MYIDCHAHLFFSPIPIDNIDKDILGRIPTPKIDFIKKIISNAREKRVDHIVGVISNPEDFSRYKEQLECENIIHIIGISRNNAKSDHPYMISLLEREIERYLPNGIGEIGLDYNYGSDKLNENQKIIFKKKQQELFKKQIRIAKEYDIPIVVHAGYGTDIDIVEILKQEKAHDIGGQIHGYMSKMELVSELIDMHFYLSFGYLHPREKELKHIIEITPLELILTETDSPYHIMESSKKFILPEDVVLIAKEIAKLKGVKLEDFTNQVNRNAKALFRF